MRSADHDALATNEHMLDKQLDYTVGVGGLHGAFFFDGVFPGRHRGAAVEENTNRLHAMRTPQSAKSSAA